ncbi:Ppx/GppA phosphatase family protein [Acidianus sp. HS-5]|uniref:Ppx/GppA phosphatase family protein n=1 Tax=Acidianus sp. HS-5 TaxID=2886040 RepID=UPI001F3C46E2|nr:Ppx/GppA phosphatase family protein [Acidianus sp. HS-5]BDC18930.1 exopolyphosphatase [Acidianus sp. HS-5]
MLSAVIDAGYNSFRLSIYDIFQNNTFRLLGSLKYFVRIGEGVKEGGRISDEKIKTAEEAFLSFKSLINAKGIKNVKAVGTSAFRYALNGKEVSDKLSEILGEDLRIVSGEEEGTFSATGITNTLPLSDAIIFEIGGGSLEIAKIEGGNATKVYQLPIGALKLSPYSEKEIRKIIKDEISTLSITPSKVIVGSGGNMRALAKLDERISGFPSNSIHGYVVPSSQISKYAKVLFSLDAEERSALPGISKERAYTIHSGAVIIDELLQHFGADKVMVSAFGMREGVLTEGVKLNKNKWLETIAFYHYLDPPWDVFNDVEKTVKGDLAFYVGASAFISSVFKMSEYLNPYDACYRMTRTAIIPGFTQSEILTIGLICKASKGKVKKKNIKSAGLDFKKKELYEYGKIVKETVEKYPLGVRWSS